MESLDQEWELKRRLWGKEPAGRPQPVEPAEPQFRLPGLAGRPPEGMRPAPVAEPAAAGEESGLGEAVARRLVALRQYQELHPEEETLRRWVEELQARLAGARPDSELYGELIESLGRAQARWMAVSHGLQQAREEIRTTDWVVARLRAPGSHE